MAHFTHMPVLQHEQECFLRQQNDLRKTGAVDKAALPTCQDQLQSPKGGLVAPHSARNPLQPVQQVALHHRHLQGPRRGQVSAWLAACFFCHAG